MSGSIAGSVAELSPAGIYELSADLRAFGHKTGLGWLQLVGHLRRFGSIPADERSVASILGVTVRFLRERAWPLLEDRLTLSDDGRRYTCPDITPWSGRQRTAARAPDRGAVRFSQQQEAANIRWGKTRPQAVQTDAQTHAPTHAERMRSDAETHAESMRDACADASENASPDASGAYASSRPSSLSLTSFLPSDSLEKAEESEREGARASDDASDAPAHAESCEPHASCDAVSDAPVDAHASERGRRKRMRQPSPSLPGTRIPADWTPSPADRLEAQRRGFDPDEISSMFRDWFLQKAGEDGLSADWSARFRVWIRREMKQPSPQQHLTIPIPGAKPAAAIAPEEPITGTGFEAQWARVQRCLKAQLGPAVYRTWLRDVTCDGLDGNEVTVSLPTPFIRDHVRGSFLVALTNAWRAENPEITRVEVCVAAPERREAAG